MCSSTWPIANVRAAFTFRARGSHTPGNGWPIVIDAFTSSTRTSHCTGRKSSDDVVEGVFDDLMRRGLDPQRDERNFVEEPGQLLVRVALCAGIAGFGPTQPPGEQIGRVILDAQDILVLQTLAADQRVGARIEIEAEKVRRRDECRLT